MFLRLLQQSTTVNIINFICFDAPVHNQWLQRRIWLDCALRLCRFTEEIPADIANLLAEMRALSSAPPTATNRVRMGRHRHQLVEMSYHYSRSSDQPGLFRKYLHPWRGSAERFIALIIEHRQTPLDPHPISPLSNARLIEQEEPRWLTATLRDYASESPFLFGAP